MRAFISYSHHDEGALKRLHTHLAMLRREGRIDTWFDREILAGSELDTEIAEQLETCELFLLLVSPDFLDSRYCFELEMQRALARHDAGEARVVPIIVEPCDWPATPLRRLKVLPRDGKPVSEWTNQNNAYLDVVQELRRIFEAEKGGSAPGISEEITATAMQRGGARRYRVKRDFDAIDRSEFGDSAFAAIRQYFEHATNEINTIANLRGRFVFLSPTSFGCTIVNRARDHGTAHITVHRRSGSSGLCEIYYSFVESAPTNTANGGFNIEADEYELHLTSMMMGTGRERERLTSHSAAEQLWADFLEQAGVTYD